MKPPRSRLRAMAEARCPRCREGKMFLYPAWNLRRFDEMRETCPVCGLAFEIEVGFYYGAMYVNYGFTVMIFFLAGFGLYHLAGDPPVWVYALTVIATVLLLMPWLYRYSRVLMLHLFGSVKYDPGAAQRYWARQ